MFKLVNDHKIHKILLSLEKSEGAMWFQITCIKCRNFHRVKAQSYSRNLSQNQRMRSCETKNIIEGKYKYKINGVLSLIRKTTNVE